MQDCVEVTGIVLKADSIGEYDRRLVILTKERGKISAFARGAKRQNSRLMAAASPFTFGVFSLYEGRNSYSLREVSQTNYFEALRSDYEGACYGAYFLELCDFCTRENNEEKEVLRLLYQSLRALCHPALDRRLVRCVFEIRLVVINGEFPGLPEGKFTEGTRRAAAFIVGTPVERLYTFAVQDCVLAELTGIAAGLQKRFLPGQFKSLEVLRAL